MWTLSECYDEAVLRTNSLLPSLIQLQFWNENIKKQQSTTCTCASGWEEVGGDTSHNVYKIPPPPQKS